MAHPGHAVGIPPIIGHLDLGTALTLQALLSVHLVKHLGVGLLGHKVSVFYLKTSAEGFPSLQYHQG